MRILTAVLALAACACSGPEMPALPEIDSSRFLPAVRTVVEQAEQAARRNAKDPGENGRLGMVLQAHEQYAAAEVCYRRANRLEPSSFRWLYYLATVQSAQGNPEATIATLEQALEADGSHLPARLKLAQVLLEAGRVEESGARYAWIAAGRPDSADAWYGLGRTQSARGDTAAAIESFRKSVELFPAFGAAHYALAQACRKTGETARAQAHLALYEKHQLAAPPLEDKLLGEVRALGVAATEYVRQGTDLEAQGKLRESVVAHLKALEVDPKLDQAHANLITLYGRLGETEKAEHHYRIVSAINPNFAEAHYGFGVLVHGQGRHREARKAFEETLRINPNHADAHNNLGYLLEIEGRQQEAIAHYEKAIAQKPEFRLAHFHLGRILTNRRQYREAIAHFEKTLAPEDDNTPGYLYALGAAWGRSGNRARAAEYMWKARAGAEARGQTQLLASVEKDLRTLGQVR